MSIINHRVLIIEDDARVSRLMSIIMTRGGFEVIHVPNGEDALSAFSAIQPHLVLLDMGLPDISGMELLQRIRKESSVPIIIVSARTHEQDKVHALNMGADDYITKPFGSEELLARARNALAHTRTTGHHHMGSQPGTYTVGDLVVDFGKHQVFRGGVNAKLTQTEFRIISLLAMHSGKVLTYDYLQEQLWGHKSGADNSLLRVNVANIRRKIESNPGEPQYLFTEIGVGYRLADAESNESTYLRRN